MFVKLLKASPLENIDPVTAVAARMEPKVRKSFLTAVEKLKGSVRMGQLRTALLRSDVNAVFQILGLAEAVQQTFEGMGFTPEELSMQEAIAQTFQDGANAAMKKLPKKIGTDVRFDLMNPKSVEILRAYEFELIRDITQETVEGIRDVVLRAFQEGGHPYEQAREIRDVIGLTARQEQAVDNFRRALESGVPQDMRRALERELRDHRFDPTLLRALSSEQRLPRARIDQMVARYRERYLKHRAEVIARTETIRAANLGQQALWRQAVDQGLIPPGAERVWITAGDERTCDFCGPLDGMTVGLEDYFSSAANNRSYTTLTPPLHPQCRCSLGLVEASLRIAA